MGDATCEVEQYTVAAEREPSSTKSPNLWGAILLFVQYISRLRSDDRIGVNAVRLMRGGLQILRQHSLTLFQTSTT